jgi:hypothetical protein
MKNLSFIRQIRDLIAHDDLSAALQQLCVLLENTPELDEAMLQSARYQDIRKQIRLGVVSHTVANLTQNQIRVGLLDLLNDLEAQPTEAQPSSVNLPLTQILREKIQHALSETMGNDPAGAPPSVIQHAEKIYNINQIDQANFS